MSEIARAEPLLADRFANRAVTLEAAEPASRISLRANEEGAASFQESLGFDLPMEANHSANANGRFALWLGPDEWLVIDEINPSETMVPKLPNRNFAAVDVSHRNTAINVSGPGAERTLNSGCPRDLSVDAFPVGACARTILGRAEIVLLRTGEESFRVECWRSFAPYVWAYLKDGARDATNG